MEGEPGAISYTFNDQSPNALAHTLDNITNVHQLGEEVKFDQLTFPYDFSVSAFVDASTDAADADDPEGERGDADLGRVVDGDGLK